jgi:hypothetical protein
MANYCSNNITVGATDSEWKEISSAFDKNEIDWPASMEGTSCYSKEISCTTKWSPTPWNDGYMGKLSESYPTALFHYVTDIEGEYRSPSTWFCDGDECNKRDAESARRRAYKAEVKRFASATPIAAEGIYHRVEVMPDGRVAADGENRFGECNIYSWKNVKAISCGNWHTVALLEDGTLVACGSNANGQCDVSNLEEEAVAVSCGRYHTAILMKSGKVEVRGTLEQEAKAPNTQEEVAFSPSDFPMVQNVRIDKYITGWEKINERIENVSIGEDLTLKKVSSDGDIYFEVVNSRGEKLGHLSTGRDKSLAKILRYIKVTAASVEPLSKRRAGTKYAALSVNLEYVESEENRKAAAKSASVIGDYVQSNHIHWSSVKKIISVFDAVAGLDDNDNILVDGFCPCSEADLIAMFK